MKGLSAVTLGLLVGLLILGMCIVLGLNIFHIQYPQLPPVCHQIQPAQPQFSQVNPPNFPPCPNQIPTQLPTIPQVAHTHNDFLCSLRDIEEVVYDGRKYYVVKGTDLTLSRLFADIASGCNLQQIAERYRLDRAQYERVVSVVHSLSCYFERN